jgi:hypothetical protein
MEKLASSFVARPKKKTQRIEPIINGPEWRVRVWRSRLSALDRPYTVQLPFTLGHGEAFRSSFAVTRDEELALSSDTKLIDPEGEPEYLTATGFRIGDDFIAPDTRDP